MKLSDKAQTGLLLAITMLGPIPFIVTGHDLLAFAVFLTAPIIRLAVWIARVVMYGDHPFILGRRNRRQGARMVDNPYRQPFINGGLFSATWWDMGWKSTIRRSRG